MSAKSLRLSNKNKKIAGVCAGFAEYFDMDPVLIRLGWVLATLFLGGGILAYIICWLVIPRDTK